MFFVLVLSLLAAFLFAESSFLQQHAARVVVADEPRAARLSGLALLMRRLLRSGTWLRGWCVNTAGFLAQAAALQLGSVAVVQPVMSTQLLFAVPLGAYEQRQRPRWRDLGFACLVCAGLAVFFTVEGASPLSGDADRDRVLLAAVSTAGAVVVLAVATLWTSAQVAAHLAAVGAGLCFAITAVFIKLTTDDLLHRGVAATACDWPGYLLAVATAGGLVLEQLAFSGGPLPWAIAAMSVTNPLASYALGMLAFRVPFPQSPAELAGIAGSGALVLVGLGGLSNSPLTQSFYAHAPSSTTVLFESIG